MTLLTIIECLEAIKQHVAFALVDDSDICCCVAYRWSLHCGDWLTQLTNIYMMT